MKEKIFETTVTFKDHDNQRELICAITGIEDKTKALEHFLAECHRHWVQAQRALDGLVRSSVLEE